MVQYFKSKFAHSNFLPYYFLSRADFELGMKSIGGGLDSPLGPDGELATTRALLNDGMCGLINAIIIIPVIFSFASIIFRDPFFNPYLHGLSKLVLLSSVIHQLSFLFCSNFPFAVGQVQDAGLVFLAAMSTDIVFLMSGKGEQHSSAAILSTTLVVLGVMTAVLGACVYAVGRLELASVVQYLPMPVLAGYLAFIGFFCGISSFGLMADQDIGSIYDLPSLMNRRSAVMIFPGIAGGALIYCSLRFLRSNLVLPLCMAVILSCFYMMLFFAGMSIEDARDGGWVQAYSEPEPFQASLRFYDFSLVDWSQLKAQLTKLLAMTVVVTVSSSLDVAAIEMEIGKPVDYNQELKTVGISNMLSGLCGGYTGSYIFSQTIFCLRRGVRTKAAGGVLAFFELLVVFFPITITAYLPKLFFGSLLIMISLDLQWEWLIVSRHKMMTSEYIVSLLTFVCIQVWGIEAGMLIGILAATFSFVGLYSQLEVVSVSAQCISNTQRTFEERMLLLSKNKKIVTIKFRGYMFFGSSSSLLKVLKGYLDNVVLPDCDDAIDMEEVLNHSLAEVEPICYSSGPGRSKAVRNHIYHAASNSEDDEAESYSKPNERSLLIKTKSPAASPSKVLKTIAGLRRKADIERGPSRSHAGRTEFVIFDFSDANGVDASACRSCFALVTSLLRGYAHITLIFSSLSISIEELFRSHGIIVDGDVVVGGLNEALELCEEQVLDGYMSLHRKHRLHSIASVNNSQDNLSQLSSSSDHHLFNTNNELLTPYVQRAALERQESLNLNRCGPESNLPVSSVFVDVRGVSVSSMDKDLHFQRLKDIMEDYLEVHNSLLVMANADKYLALDVLSKYFRIQQVEAGDLVFDVNEPADELYILDSGLVQLLRYPSSSVVPPWTRLQDPSEGMALELQRIRKLGVLQIQVTTGGMFGDSSFILNRQHGMRAVAVMRSFVFVITRQRYHAMERNHPKLLFILQQILMKSAAIWGETTLQQLHPAPWRAI